MDMQNMYTACRNHHNCQKVINKIRLLLGFQKKILELNALLDRDDYCIVWWWRWRFSPLHIRVFDPSIKTNETKNINMFIMVTTIISHDQAIRGWNKRLKPTPQHHIEAKAVVVIFISCTITTIYFIPCLTNITLCRIKNLICWKSVENSLRNYITLESGIHNFFVITSQSSW